MKHTLILLTLMPVLLLAQKGETPKVIKLPFYDAKLPTTDSTNMIWIDTAGLRDGATLVFENPDLEIAAFSLIANSKHEIVKMGGLKNQLHPQTIGVIERAILAKDVITLHIQKIYLKGNLRTANWTYRIRVR